MRPSSGAHGFCRMHIADLSVDEGKYFLLYQPGDAVGIHMAELHAVDADAGPAGTLAHAEGV